MSKLKVVLGLVTALAVAAPAITATASTQYSQPQSYTQHYDRNDRHHDRWERQQRREERRLNREQRRDYQRYMRERERYRINQNTFAATLAGALIGSVFVDRYGERRQYYVDRRTGRYYYYDYNARRYYYDPMFRYENRRIYRYHY